MKTYAYCINILTKGVLTMSDIKSKSSSSTDEKQLPRFSQGNIIISNNPLNLAINGNGSFVLDHNGETLFTRAGAFGCDQDGNITNEYMHQLIGYLPHAVTGDITDVMGPLSIQKICCAQSTSTLTTGITLDSRESLKTMPFIPGFTPANPPAKETYNCQSTAQIYDSLGNPHVMVLYYVKNPAVNSWNVYVGIDGYDTPAITSTATPFILNFNTNGQCISDPISVAYNPIGATTQTITIDLCASRQAAQNFAIFTLIPDGYSTGALIGVSVDKEGILRGRYTNSASKQLGQVALANSANKLLGKPGTTNFGTIQTVALEDLRAKPQSALFNGDQKFRNSFIQGNLVTTSNPLDLALNGPGFFVLNDGSKNVFSRAGAFCFDQENNITDKYGRKLIGYLPDPITGDITGVMGPISIPKTSGSAPAEQLSEIKVNYEGLIKAHYDHGTTKHLGQLRTLDGLPKCLI